MFDVPTVEMCRVNAARLLVNAEMETDRQLMSEYNDLARTWLMLSEDIRTGELI